MNYTQLAHELLRATDGLNNLDLDDICDAIGVDYEPLDDHGYAMRIDIDDVEFMDAELRFDTNESGDYLDLSYTVYELIDGPPRPIAEMTGIRITNITTLADALFDVRRWTV